MLVRLTGARPKAMTNIWRLGHAKRDRRGYPVPICLSQARCDVMHRLYRIAAVFRLATYPVAGYAVAKDTPVRRNQRLRLGIDARLGCEAHCHGRTAPPPH